MPTLKAIVRQVIVDGGHAVGRSEAVTALATGSVTAATLGLGGLSEQLLRDNWLLRLDTATAADRFRRCTAFTSSSGLCAHGGTDYVDTTITGEQLDILVPEMEPSLLLVCIQWALGQLHHLERTMIPTSMASRYWLGDFDWITRRSLVRSVKLRESPVLNRNDNFEHWNTVNTSGALQPDDWTLAGSGGSQARTTTGNEWGYYSNQVTRSGTDVTLTHTIGLLRDGVNTLAGEQVGGGIAGTADAASQVRLRITDGVATQNSDYLTNGSYSQAEISAFTVDDSATTLTVQVRIETLDGTPTIDRAFACIGEPTDAVWLDRYDENEENVMWQEATAPLSFTTVPWGYGRQFVVHNLRPYPQFDSTRLLAGTADGDSTDAPVETVAAGALYHFYDTQKDNLRYTPEKRGEFARMAVEWGNMWKMAQRAHIHENGRSQGGLPIPRQGHPALARRPRGR